MSSSTATSDNDLEAEEVSAGIEDDASQKELQRIQTECTAMVGLLKNLEKEEHDLHCELKILAREAMLCGFAMDLVEPPRPKRRKLTAKKKQAAEVASDRAAFAAAAEQAKAAAGMCAAVMEREEARQQAAQSQAEAERLQKLELEAKHKEVDEASYPPARLPG